MKSDSAREIVDGLMLRYTERVPDVGAILALMKKSGLIDSPSCIENDHIAFRTMGVPQLGIASLEKIFLHYGWQRQDSYDFPAKKLNARWYSPPIDELPRVFISELNVGHLSNHSQRIIHSYTDEVEADPVDSVNLDDPGKVVDFLHRGLWRTPTWTDFQFLSNESEYAGWVIYNRYYLNHFTISVHNLPGPFDSVERFSEFLIQHGFKLNDSGGLVKTSPDGLLAQSSTVARMVMASFDDGRGGIEQHEIAGSYVEFAERRVLPGYRHLPKDQIKRQHRREGFEAENADRIFESTYREQTNKTRS